MDAHALCGMYGSVVQVAVNSMILLAVKWSVEEMSMDIEIKGGGSGVLWRGGS